MKLVGKLFVENSKEVFYDEVFKVLWGYISDKFNILVFCLFKDNVEEKFRNYGVSDELIKDFLNVLNECEFVCFVLGDESQVMDKVYLLLLEVMSKMENLIKC